MNADLAGQPSRARFFFQFKKATVPTWKNRQQLGDFLGPFRWFPSTAGVKGHMGCLFGGLGRSLTQSHVVQVNEIGCLGPQAVQSKHPHAPHSKVEPQTNLFDYAFAGPFGLQFKS